VVPSSVRYRNFRFIFAYFCLFGLFRLCRADTVIGRKLLSQRYHFIGQTSPCYNHGLCLGRVQHQYIFYEHWLTLSTASCNLPSSSTRTSCEYTALGATLVNRCEVSSPFITLCLRYSIIQTVSPASEVTIHVTCCQKSSKSPTSQQQRSYIFLTLSECHREFW
jgi:hypothetical protein